MADEPLLLLAPLFAALLSGCPGCFNLEDSKQSFYLTPNEYALWARGIDPAGGTAGTPTSGDTGDTAGDTTGDTGTMLTDDEICMLACQANTAGPVKSCTIESVDGNVFKTVQCVVGGTCDGRRHACVRSHGRSEGSGAAVWLARAAHDEAASVHAFLALAAELAAHGAPGRVLARIATAADDERRHAALVTDLARRHGATIPALAITPTPLCDLLALAVENMVEGCVRETWAALSAAHQARHARTLELRDLYASIAADEARHAELAWSIHTWLFRQLLRGERTMVTAARQLAIRQLHATLAALPDEPELLALGVPDHMTALHLLAGLDAALWSQAA